MLREQTGFGLNVLFPEFVFKGSPNHAYLIQIRNYKLVGLGISYENDIVSIMQENGLTGNGPFE